eukprot:scaffold22804_cov74-Phaeocystis_antarctica.AAC.10
MPHPFLQHARSSARLHSRHPRAEHSAAAAAGVADRPSVPSFGSHTVSWAPATLMRWSASHTDMHRTSGWRSGTLQQRTAAV